MKPHEVKYLQDLLPILKEEKFLSIKGFGKFKVVPSRKGKLPNPHSGEVAPKRAWRIKFTPHDNLKDFVNKQ